MTELAQYIHDVQDRKEAAHIIYKSHDRWPLPLTQGTECTQEGDSKRDLRISLLDSSFNPPTLAHLALARSKRPGSASPSERAHQVDYDARLLLLSVRNADKAPPKPGEPTYEQRLDMMKLLAKELEDAPVEHESSPTRRNIAVAIIDEPTFVRKSAVLRQYLRNLVTNLGGPRSDGSKSEVKDPKRKEIKLSFLMGFDTLERFLAPRYYNNSLIDMHDALRKFFASPPDGDGSEVVCAWRGQKQVNRLHPGQPLQVEEQVTEVQERLRETLSIAQPFISTGSVSFLPLTDYEMSLSSTEVRGKRMEGIQEWRTMVPSRVSDYIENQGLYMCK
ncbi:hypothetical protein ACEPAH_8300 [Sanghuangporus vaninii]